MILTLFYVWEDAKVWAYWNYSLDIHLEYLGPDPEFPSRPTVTGEEAAAATDALILVELKW